MEAIKPGLSDDFDKVASAEAAIEVIEGRIIDYTASTSEVLQWYFAKDPIQQGYYENLARTISSFDTESFKSQIMRDGRRAEAMEKGAAALAVSVFLPTATRGIGTDWHPVVSSWYLEANGLDFDPDEISASELIIFCFANCLNEAMTMEDFETLQIATEMLAKSSNDHAYELAAVLKNGGDWQDLKQELVAWQFSQRQAINLVLAKHMSGLITDVMLDSIDENPEARRFLLRTAPLYIANEINGICTPADDSEESPDSKQERTDVLLKYITILEAIATGDNRVQHEGKAIKGSLHEAIWLLDMLLLREYHQSDFTIIPSTSNEDMPKIGYPTYNRSFDFRVIRPSGGDWLIQLKSTPNNPNKNNRTNYHPEIDLKAEQNFRDFHYKTLRSKLNLYKAFISNDYSDPELAARVEKMALETAVAVFEEYTNYDESRYQQMLERFENFGITFDIPPPNYDKRIMAVLSGEEDPGFNRMHKRVLKKLSPKPARAKQSNIKPTKRTNGPTGSRRKK